MRWCADLSDTDWDRGFDLTLRLRDAFVALRLGWITFAGGFPSNTPPGTAGYCSASGWAVRRNLTPQHAGVGGGRPRSH